MIFIETWNLLIQSRAYCPMGSGNHSRRTGKHEKELELELKKNNM